MRSPVRCLVSIVATLAMVTGAAAPYAQTPTQFNLPAQPLADALRAVGTQTNTSVVFDPSLVEGRRAPAIDAHMSLDQALAKLLAGTGLTHQFLNERTVVLATAGAKKATATSDISAAGSSLHLAQSETEAMKKVDNTDSSRQTTQASSEEPADSSGSKVQEVIVTAQRYEQNLQDVPISVTAFSADDIAARSTTGVQELAQFVPNLTFSNHSASGASGNVIFIRGIGQQEPGIEFNPGVGVYLDGIYLGVMRGLDLDLVDVERMEVLRGPQGTLFGKNTVGGAINIVSRGPSDEFEGSAEIIAGRFDRLDGIASLNVPIVPGQLAARFSIASRNRDGYADRVDFLTGDAVDDMGDVGALSGRATFDFTPTPVFSLTLAIDATRSRQKTNPWTLVATQQTEFTDLLDPDFDPDWGDAYITGSDLTSYAAGANTNDLDSFGAAAIATVDLGAWTLRSLTGYRDIETQFLVDVDSSPYPLLSSFQLTEQQQFSQEVLLSGSSFDNRLDSIFGVFFMESNAGSDRPAGLFTDELLPFGAEPQQGDESRDWAVFSHATWDFTDRLGFTGGLRYTKESKDSAQRGMGQRADGFSAVTGRAGFEYRWSDDVMTYVSAARGFKGGGVNSAADFPEEFEAFDPEYVWTYEGGVKTDLFDGAMRLNAAVFYSDYQDIQFRVRVPHPVQGVASYVGNAAAAEIKGFEIEMIAAPTDALRFNFGVGYTDAEYTELDEGSPVTLDSEFPETPEWNVTVGGQYTMPLSSTAELVARFDYAYKTEIQHDIENNPLLAQDAYGLLNTRLTYRNIPGDWSVSLFGTNLTDEHYIQGGVDLRGFLGFAVVQYARPREWGISLRKGF